MNKIIKKENIGIQTIFGHSEITIRIEQDQDPEQVKKYLIDLLEKK